MQQNRRENWRDILRELMFEGDNPFARFVDITLIILISVSILAAILETIPSIHSAYGTLLWGFEWLFTVIFTIEYVLRVISANKPNKFIFSFSGIIDFLSILPLYIIILFGAGEIITIVRVLRFIRIGSRLARLSKDFSDTMHFLVHIKNKLGNHEQIVYYFKNSRKYFFFGYFFATFLIVVATSEIVLNYFSDLFSGSIIIKILGYLLFVIAILLLIRFEIKTWYTRYAITNQRVLISKGILHEDFTSTNYAYMADTLIYQSLLDRILNIGKVQIRTTGSEYDNIELKAISKPLMVKKIIHNNIMNMHHLHRTRKHQ